MNTQDTLTKDDWKKWVKDTILYCLIPTAIIFLQNLQVGEYKIALGAAYMALLTSAINLLSKYKAGIEPSQISTGNNTNGVAELNVVEPKVAVTEANTSTGE